MAESDLISRQVAIEALSTPHGILYPIRTIESLPSAQPELIEQAAYVRGFEQGRTQGMIDAQSEQHYCRECKWSRYYINVDKYGKSKTSLRCINWVAETDEEGYCHEWKKRTDG